MRVAFIQGETVERVDLPKVFKNYPAFAKMSESKWNEYGFYRIVYPELTATQKHGANGTLIDNEYVIEVIEKSPEELANEAEQQLNSDISQQTINQRREDGSQGYDQAMAVIERKYRTGEITANQAKGAVQFFDTLIEGLNRGQWIIVQIKMNAATVPAGYQSLFDTIKTKVDTYITNSY